MIIKGIGVDIEEIGRFIKLPYQSNRSFYKKIFTPAEIKYCLSKIDPYPRFAARFAAKEAIIKALNKKVVDMRHIEVVITKSGKPTINSQFPIPNSQFPISLSHTKDYAIAFAVWLS